MEQDQAARRLGVGLAALGLVGLGLWWLAGRVQVTAALEPMRGDIEGLGPWGPVAFGLIYVACVLLMLPTWPLSLMAGALFGPWVGTVVASLASTTGAGLAFLIARGVGRGPIERRLGHHPRLAALDRALAVDGWKVVALLRLSPAVPFNLQNYAYGLTRIRFWPCVLTSWAAMLPTTILYVGLGHAGRLGLESTDGHHRTPAEWAGLAVGLVATLALTLLAARRARLALRERDADVPRT